jgi:tight adherence protein B
LKGIITVLGFISAMLIFYQLVKGFVVKNDYMARLRRYTNVEESRGERSRTRKRDSAASIRGALTKGIGKIRFLDGYKKRIQVELTRAHLLVKAEEFLAFSLILFTISFLLVILARGVRMWPLALIAGIVGWFVPSFLVKSRIRKRLKLLNEQLGDAVTMMSNSLKAGYSFFQAVDMVAEEMSGPIAEEFGILQKEVNLGLNTEKALENMVTRIKSEDLELMVTAVMIQRQVGGNLAEVLDKITETIRDRVKIKGELKAITAQGRISGLVISILPLILCFIVYMINPGQMSLLFTRPLGLLMVGLAAVMEITGIILIRRIVRIEI